MNTPRLPALSKVAAQLRQRQTPDDRKNHLQNLLGDPAVKEYYDFVLIEPKSCANPDQPAHWKFSARHGAAE
jgi:hypothetical protein